MSPTIITPTSPKAGNMGLKTSRFVGSASNSREATPTVGKSEAKTTGDAELAAAFKSDLINIRNLVTCSICDQLLYEPWTLGCGHTYCYSCLCNWFVPNKRKKTCPECRTAVKDVPAPAFMVKQMVEIFCKRSELMPCDESIDQHNKKRAEETADVDKDKNSPEGLFKGTFPPRRAELLFDESDGVFRCPHCQHEHEGGPRCSNCGTSIEDGYGFSDYDDDADLDDLEDLEVDLDAELAEHHHHHHHHFLDIPNFAWGARHHLHHISHHHHHEDSDAEGSDSSEMDGDSEEDEDDGGSLQDFVVPDEEPADHTTLIRLSNNRQPITISDDESDEGGAVSNGRRRLPRAGIDLRPSFQLLDSSPVPPSVPTVADSTNGSENDETNTEADMLRSAGWSPLDTENEENESEAEDQGRHTYESYRGYASTEDEHNTDNESDTNTMRNGASDDEDPALEAMSSTPVRAYGDYHGAHIMDYDTPHSYENDGDDDNSEVDFATATDDDGDTEMSASPGLPRTTRGVSVSTEDFGFSREGYAFGIEDNGTPRRDRGVSISTNGYDEMGEDLGPANEVHEIEDDSSDSSIRPPPRRSRRQYGNPQVQQTDPRISMMFAEHQSLRGAMQFEADTRRVELASRMRRLTAYRLQPTRRIDPLRSSRSPSATRVISSSNRAARMPRAFQGIYR